MALNITKMNPGVVSKAETANHLMKMGQLGLGRSYMSPGSICIHDIMHCSFFSRPHLAEFNFACFDSQIVLPAPTDDDESECEQAVRILRMNMEMHKKTLKEFVCPVSKEKYKLLMVNQVYGQAWYLPLTV